MLRASCLVLLTTALLASPASSGGFDQFADIGELAEHLLSGGPPRDGIPAMTDPQIVEPDQVTYVNPDDLVLGVVINGVARAYPHNLGWWHEIINDEVGGEYISATFCPLTGTGQVFKATGDGGERIEFGVSGMLINSNLVMYDRRDNQTLYPQMIYTGIAGPRKEETLELWPVVETTWAMWQRMYPETGVAQAATGLERYSANQQAAYSLRRYGTYPYGPYRTDHTYLIARPTTAEPDFTFNKVKDLVLGLCINEEVRSYAHLEMPDGAVINDELGGEGILIVYDAGSHTALPYYRTVGGEPLTFYAVEPEGDLPIEMRDVETGTRWDMRGVAVAGKLAGRRLDQVPAYNSFWFAWDTYYNGGGHWEGDGIIDAPPPMTAVADELGPLPDDFALGQNYPNPFNPSTVLTYTLARRSHVRLAIHNAAGQVVRVLADGPREAGRHAAGWDGRDDRGAAAASGSYLYRLELVDSGFSQVRVMTLLH